MLNALRSLTAGATLGLIATVGLLVGSPAAAQDDDFAGTYRLHPTHASLTWKVNHLGLSFYTARFTRFDATLDIDPAKPTDAKLTATVDVSSLETDYPNAEQKDFDKELVTAARWFNNGDHPDITFASTGLEMTGDNTAKLTGDLTFLGATHPVTLDVTLNGQIMHPFANKPAMGFSAVGKLDRTTWGMSELVPNVGAEVQLLIEAEFIKG